jgi:DNA-binding CsgD family transcriptional regulator
MHKSTEHLTGVINTIHLTRKEIEILQLLQAGLSGPQIAQKLFVSYNTVRTHKKNLHFKLEVNSTVQLLNASQKFIGFNN